MDKKKNRNYGLTGGEIFQLIWRGWFAGVVAIMLPLFVLVFVISLFTASISPAVEPLLAIIMIPLIAAGQGVLAAVLVLIGLKVWPIKASLPE